MPRRRRRNVLYLILFSIFFISILFLSGYIVQQRSIIQIQYAIAPPRVGNPANYPATLYTYDDNDDSYDDDIDLPSSNPLLSIKKPNSNSPAILNGWRPRKGPNGEDLSLADQQLGTQSHPIARPRKPWAYVQFVNTPHDVCAAVMILGRLHELKSRGVRVLLYPREWDEKLAIAQGIREEREKRFRRGKKGAAKTSTSTDFSAATRKSEIAWPAKGQYRRMQDQEKIFPGPWPGEESATPLDKTARRILLSAYTRYGVQLIPVDSIPLADITSPTQHVDPDALPHPRRYKSSSPGGSSESSVRAQSRTATRLDQVLTKAITPLHLFNLTQFSRAVYLSPVGLPMRKMDTLVASLPWQAKIASPRRYWDIGKEESNSSMDGSDLSSHFLILSPDAVLFKSTVSRLVDTEVAEHWRSRITSNTPEADIFRDAVGGNTGFDSLGTLAAYEVLHSLFSPTALILPPHPWHFPVHELYHPTPAAGRRHGALLGGVRGWDVAAVRKETYYVLFTTIAGSRMRPPWAAQDMRIFGEMEERIGKIAGHGEGERECWREWYRLYAALRRDVCLLDLEPNWGTG
ncbi:hypothetical protein BDZ91DRAFT_721222 [Kalaharituber pfeilii]|nr:hypothetical protein BDZ91DRAFT_721222 [Kalaharituber pfeilii]